MKTNAVKIDTLSNYYSHPSVLLFRSLELKAVHELTKKMKFGSPSLDLGCGDGYLTEKLFDSKFTYGLDNDEAGQVQQAISNKIYNKVLIESADDMSIPDNKLNFIFSNSVIEHIPNNSGVLSEVSRVLRKGGYFVFTSPSKYFSDYLFLSNVLGKWGLGFVAKYYVSLTNKKLNHYHLYDHYTWSDRLEQHGLKLVKYKYYLEKETMMLIDKMSLKIMIMRNFDSNAENTISNKNWDQLINFYKSDNVVDENGASVAIVAKKK